MAKSTEPTDEQWAEAASKLPPIVIDPKALDAARERGESLRVYPQGFAETGAPVGAGLRKEVGWSGVEVTGGLLHTLDHNEALTPDRWRGNAGELGIVDKMRREDPAVAAVVLAWTQAGKSVEFTFEPPPDATPLELEQAEFVETCYRDHLHGGLEAYIEQTMSVVWRGTMMFEQVFRFDETLGRAVLDKLAPRLPWTVDEWFKNKAGEWGILQCTPNTDGPRTGTGLGSTSLGTFGKAPTLPSEKLQHFTFSPDGDSPEGISILRPAHANYRARKRNLILSMQGYERSAFGIPYVEVDPRVPVGSETVLDSLLSQLRTGARAYLALPPGYTLKFADFPMKGADLREDRVSAGKAIARAALAMHLFTGEDAGAYGHIKGQLDAFESAVQSVVNYIARINSKGRHAVIKRLIDFNWTATERYPVMRAGVVRVGDFGRLITAFKEAKESGGLTLARADEIWLRKLLGAPEAPPEEEVEEEEPEEAPPAGPGEPLEPQPGPPATSAAGADEGGEQGEDREDEGAALRVAASRRAFRPLEEHVSRQEEPAEFDKFARENNAFGDGIHAVWGLRATGDRELQSIRFDAMKYTPAQAKEWLREHNFKPVLEVAQANTKSPAAAEAPFPGNPDEGRQEDEFERPEEEPIEKPATDRFVPMEGLTTIVDGHAHPYAAGAASTGTIDGHAHPIEPGAEVTREVDGHVHEIPDHLRQPLAEHHQHIAAFRGQPAEFVMDMAMQGPGGREVSACEETVRFSETKAQMDGAKQDMARAVKRYRNTEGERFAQDVARSGDLVEAQKKAPKGIGRLAGELEAILRRVYKGGERSVEAELQRQDQDPVLKARIKEGIITRGQDEEADLEGMRPSDQLFANLAHAVSVRSFAPRNSKGKLRKPKAKAAGKSVTDELDPERAVMAIAGSTAEAVARRMTNEAVAQYQSLSIGGVLPAGAKATASTLIADSLSKLALAPDLRQAQKDANTMFGLGRVQKGRSEDVSEAVFSNLLESQTCPPCAANDQRTIPMSRVDDFATPYVLCEGGDMCNCLLLFVRK